MSTKCAVCAKFIGRTGTVVCSKCNGHYHCACAGIPAGAAVPREWSCPTCKRPNVQATNSRSASGSPVVKVSSGAGTLVTTEPPVCEGTVQLSLGDEIQLFREELQALRHELQEFRQEFRDVRACMADVSAKVDTLESRVDAVEKAVADGTVSVATKVLEEAIATLQVELSERDQELLANDVQLSNVPEEPGESAVGLVARVGAKLGVELDVRDVVFAHRAGREREAGRPRPLVVRLARRAVRDELLKQARVRRGATTEGLGLAAAPQRFYANERLTPANRQLFQRAREAARAAAWRFVWTRDGKIYARKADGQPRHRLRILADLAIFTPVTIAQPNA